MSRVRHQGAPGDGLYRRCGQVDPSNGLYRAWPASPWNSEGAMSLALVQVHKVVARATGKRPQQRYGAREGNKRRTGCCRT